MAFEFRLERVLNVKKAHEDRLQQELAGAERRVRQAQTAVTATRGRMKERADQLRQLRSGPLALDRLRVLMDYVERLKRDLAEEESRLGVCCEQERACRAALLDAVKERKMLEVLRDRDFNAYRAETSRKDQLATDDMARDLSLKRRRG